MGILSNISREDFEASKKRAKERVYLGKYAPEDQKVSINGYDNTVAEPKVSINGYDYTQQELSGKLRITDYDKMQSYQNKVAGTEETGNEEITSNLPESNNKIKQGTSIIGTQSGNTAKKSEISEPVSRAGANEALKYGKSLISSLPQITKSSESGQNKTVQSYATGIKSNSPDTYNRNKERLIYMDASSSTASELADKLHQYEEEFAGLYGYDADREKALNKTYSDLDRAVTGSNTASGGYAYTRLMEAKYGGRDNLIAARDAALNELETERSKKNKVGAEMMNLSRLYDTKKLEEKGGIGFKTGMELSGDDTAEFLDALGSAAVKTNGYDEATGAFFAGAKGANPKTAKELVKAINPSGHGFNLSETEVKKLYGAWKNGVKGKDFNNLFKDYFKTSIQPRTTGEISSSLENQMASIYNNIDNPLLRGAAVTGANLVSSGVNAIIKPISTVQNIGEEVRATLKQGEAKGYRADPSRMTASKISEGIRAGSRYSGSNVTADLLELANVSREKGVSIGETLYDIGDSIIDNTINYAMFGSAIAITNALSAGGSTIYYQAKRGTSVGKTWAMAVANGAAEYLGEKVAIGLLEKSVDKAMLLNSSRFKAFVKAAAPSFINESLNEGATEAMNILADVLILGDEGEVKEYLKEAMESGKYSDESKALFMYCFNRIMEASVIGGFSGLGMNGIHILGSRTAMQNRDYRKDGDAIKSEGTERFLIDTAVTSRNDDTKMLGENLRKSIQDGNGANSIQLGKLHAMVANDIQNGEIEGMKDYDDGENVEFVRVGDNAVEVDGNVRELVDGFHVFGIDSNAIGLGNGVAVVDVDTGTVLSTGSDFVDALVKFDDRVKSEGAESIKTALDALPMVRELDIVDYDVVDKSAIVKYNELSENIKSEVEQKEAGQKETYDKEETTEQNTSEQNGTNEVIYKPTVSNEKSNQTAYDSEKSNISDEKQEESKQEEKSSALSWEEIDKKAPAYFEIADWKAKEIQKYADKNNYEIVGAGRNENGVLYSEKGVIRETEKAIQIGIKVKENGKEKEWKVFVPKSAVKEYETKKDYDSRINSQPKEKASESEINAQNELQTSTSDGIIENGDAKTGMTAHQNINVEGENKNERRIGKVLDEESGTDDARGNSSDISESGRERDDTASPAGTGSESEGLLRGSPEQYKQDIYTGSSVQDGQSDMGNDQYGADREREYGDGGSGRDTVLGDEAQGNLDGKQKTDNDGRGNGRSIEADRRDVQESGRPSSDNGYGRMEQGDNDSGSTEDGGLTESGEDVASESSDSEDGASGEAEIPAEKNEKSKKKPVKFELSSDIDGEKPSLDKNLEVLELVDKLEKSGEKATEAEKAVLASFKGWGGVTDIIYHENSEKVMRIKELLGKEGFREAQRGVTSQFFTPTYVIDGVYKMLNRLGVTGGNMLEPSCGVGSFFGRMPSKLYNNSNLYATELDRTPARITSLIYDGANVTNGGFQYSKYADNSMDYVVGNVPFDNIVKISLDGKKYALHDYFMVKSMKLAKPGGIVALITSTGTMDKTGTQARSELAKYCDLIAAYRFPNGMFGTSAGTQAGSDLLIFKKRGEGTAYTGEKFVNVYFGTPEEIGAEIDIYGKKYAEAEKSNFAINEYFRNHPENIFGELVVRNGQYGNELYVQEGFDDIADMMNEAVKKLPKNIFGSDGIAKSDVINDGSTFQIGKDKNGTYYYYDKDNNPAKMNPAQIKKYENYRKIVDAYNNLVEKSTDGSTSEAELKKLRGELGKAYDDFVSDKSTLAKGKKENRLGEKSTSDLLINEPEYWKIRGIEIYDRESKTYSKGNIFEKNTFRKKKIETAKNSSEALSLSIGNRGKVDLKYMSDISKIPIDKLISELDDAIILNPDGEYELKNVYASGNIYKKLDEAKKAAEKNPAFNRNVQLLENAIPLPYDASTISVKLGSPWVGEDILTEFAKNVLGLSGYNAKVTYSEATGTWGINGYIGNTTYSSSKVSVEDLFNSILNQLTIQVKYKNRDGREVVDEEKTKEARAAADRIRDKFEEWIFETPERTSEVVSRFNRTFNAFKPVDYSEMAKYIDFSDVDEAFNPRDYQKTVVARTVFGGNTLLAHGVGTGKTSEMIMSAMTLKKLGITHKNLFVVPTNKPEDFKKEILNIYPNANIVMLSTDNLPSNKEQRNAFFSNLASNDFDIAIATYTSFTKVGLSDEAELLYLEERSDELIQALEDSGKYGDKRARKRLESQLENLEEQIKKVLEEGKDNGITLEEIGIDGLFVDEAHNFKNLAPHTHLNISGIGQSTSQRAEDIDSKISSIRRSGGRVVFATATPISNSLSEAYTMLKYINPEALREAGCYSFEGFLKNFCTIEKKMKAKSTGDGFEEKDALIFSNVNQLTSMLRQSMDVLRTEDVIKDLPKAENVVVNTEKKGELGKAITQFSGVLKRILTTGSQKERRAAALRASTAIKAAACDIRLVAGPLLEVSEENISNYDFKDSKINRCVQNVIDEYKRTDYNKGAQLIFCDYGTGSGTAKTYTFDLYGDIIKKLEEGGIPSKEITVMSKWDGDEKRQELFDKVNAGKIRVVLGTYAKMSEGLNVQERLCALHEINAPDKPTTIEQANGRAKRHGNSFDNVKIFTYIQEGSGDAVLWDRVKTKNEFINQAMNGEVEIGDIEDTAEEELSYDEALSIAMGDPAIKENADLTQKLNKLEVQKRSFEAAVKQAKNDVATLPEEIERRKAIDESYKKDIEKAKAIPKDFEITINGKKFTKYKDAAVELQSFVLKKAKDGSKLGEYGGFELFLKETHSGRAFTVKGNGEYTVDFTETFQGSIERLKRFFEKRLVEMAEYHKSITDSKQVNLNSAIELSEKKFSKQAEIDSVKKRLEELKRHFLAMKEKAPAIENGMEISNEEVFGTMKRIVGSSEDDNEWIAEREKGNKSSVKSLGEIVEKTRKEFGIPISTGNQNFGNAAGVYKAGPEAIRTKLSNDVVTIAHELGHHLDKLYGITKLSSISEAEKLLPKDLIANYEKSEIPHEAVAEFCRIYLKKRSLAKKMAPNFFNEFENAISSKDLASLHSLSDDVNAYLSSDFKERLRASNITSEEAKKQSRRYVSAKEVIKYEIEKFRTKYVDKFDPIKKALERNGADDRAYILAVNSLNAIDRGNAIITDEFSDFNAKYMGKSFLDCLEGITDKTLSDFSDYLKLRHMPELIRAGKQVSSDPMLSDIDEINSAIADFEANNPEFVTAANEVYGYTDRLLDLQEQAGLISSETHKKLKKMYPNYVPFKRNVGDVKINAIKARRGIANQSGLIKRMKGSGLDTISPLESIISNTYEVMKAVSRQNAMRELVKVADMAEGFGGIMERVDPSVFGKKISIKDVKSNAIKQIIEIGGDAVSQDQIEDVQELLDTVIADDITHFDISDGANAKRHIVTVLQDGKPAFYQVHDELLYKSITSMDTEHLGVFVNALGTFGKWQKMFITTLNPLFSGSNAAKDIVTAYIYGDDTMLTKYILHYGKATIDVMRKTPEYELYRRMGGGQSSKYSALDKGPQKTLRKINAKKSGSMDKALNIAGDLVKLGMVEDANNYVESIPRFMAFSQALKNGDDVHTAFYKSQKITENFMLGGTATPVTNKVFTFSNASVRSIEHLKNAIVDASKDPKKLFALIYKMIIVPLIFSAAKGIWNYANDEEGYTAASNFMKNNYHLVSTGDGKFIRLPKDRELSIIRSAFERTFDYAFKDKKAFDEFGGYIIDQFNPGMLPTDFTSPETAAQNIVGNIPIIGSVAEIALNVDYRGSKIVPDSLKDELPEDQYYNTTSKAAVFLGKTFHASPLQIDHFIDSFGLVGTLNKALAPVDSSSIKNPVSARFSMDSVYSTDVFNRVYTEYNRANDRLKRVNNGQNALMAEKYGQASKFITVTKKLIRDIPDTDDQRKATQKLQRIISNMDYSVTKTDNAAVNVYNNVKKNGNSGYEEIFTGNTLPSQKLTRNGTSVIMSVDDYIDYIAEYQDAQTALRHVIFSGYAAGAKSEFEDDKWYKKRFNIAKMSDEEKCELYASAMKEVKSEITEKYKDKYKDVLGEKKK